MDNNRKAAANSNFHKPQVSIMKIDNSKGWTEAIVDENCSINKFCKIVLEHV